MEIKSYLTPATIEVQSYELYQWGSSIQRFTEDGFPDLDGIKIAILGIGESRNAGKMADAPMRLIMFGSIFIN